MNLDITLDDILLPEATPAQGPQASEPGLPARDTEWLRFESDLRSGLQKAKRAVMAQIRSGKAPKKLSVAWVLRQAGRGRSQFYKNHGEFERRIDLAQRAVLRLLDLRSGKRKVRPTMTSLAEDNRVLRARVRELEAVETSKLASLLFDRAFPRDVSLLIAENGALKAEVDRQRGEVEALRSYIRSLGKHVQIPRMKEGNISIFSMPHADEV